MASELHTPLNEIEFTYDHVNLVPVEVARGDPSKVRLTTKLSQRLTLEFPIISSPMDTITRSAMAILVARLGGIGVIDAGLSPELQLAEIQKVRRWKAGFVFNPEVLGPDATVGDVIKSDNEYGYSSFPITWDGTRQTPVIGIITSRNVLDFRASEFNTPIHSIMTTRDDLVFARAADTVAKNDLKTPNDLIKKKGLDTLPILDDEDRVVALVTRSDIDKNRTNPYSTTDENKQLKVLAAVESRPEKAIPRLEAIVNSGISGIVIDARNVYCGYKEIASYAKRLNPDLDVIVGNIVHPNVLREILEEAAELVDAFRQGIGTGEVCTTQEDMGISRAMGSSSRDLDAAYSRLNENDRYGYKGFIPDGGMKLTPRYFLVSAALHKNFGGVMIGSALGGFKESPAKLVYIDGKKMKLIRGMGSEGAFMDREEANRAGNVSDAGQERYAVTGIPPEQRFPEGIERPVAYIENGPEVLLRLMGGIRTDLHALNVKDFEELYQKAVIYPAV